MLTELASPAALVVAAIFLIAAAAKLRSPGSTRRAVAAFGLPPFVASLLGPVEVMTAAALLFFPRVGAVLAVMALVSFTTIVVRSIRRGLSVRCGCFGASDDRPVGIDTVVRNLLLLVLTGPALAITRVERPTLPAMIVVGAGTISAMIAIALVRLGQDVGTIFVQRLPAPVESA